MSDTISDTAYKTLRERILDGVLAPGSFLVEQELANELGVSRTPVKGALRRLEADGLIQSEGYKRAMVREFSAEETTEILEIRALLESYAARLAARRISDQQLATLEQLAAAMDAIADNALDSSGIEAFAKLNDDFHQLIIDASGSKRLQDIMKPIFQIHLLLMKRFRQRIEHNLKRSCWHHREILNALKDHNEEWAMMQMQTHLFAAGSWRPEQDSDE